VYCGRYQNQYTSSGRKIRTHVDHYVPLARGGTGAESNLVLSCEECNLAKGTDIWEFGCRKEYYYSAGEKRDGGNN
jgi:hypothetical protein